PPRRAPPPRWPLQAREPSARREPYSGDPPPGSRSGDPERTAVAPALAEAALGHAGGGGGARVADVASGRQSPAQPKRPFPAPSFPSGDPARALAAAADRGVGHEVRAAVFQPRAFQGFAFAREADRRELHADDAPGVGDRRLRLRAYPGGEGAPEVLAERQ